MRVGDLIKKENAANFKGKTVYGLVASKLPHFGAPGWVEIKWIHTPYRSYETEDELELISKRTL